ncbi:MAG: DeoR/GlpR family DNA-binding transcription regulator [Thermodesulfobacteriota bacterium]
MKNPESLLPAERRKHILDILTSEFTARSSSLSEMFKVSEMTIRRDFDVLEQQGLAERIHGGAVFKQERVAGKFHYKSSIKENLEEKKQIAREAATMIEPHDVVFLGEGTTTALTLRYIEPGLPCTIFTNNHGVGSEANGATTAEIIFLPGTYNSMSNAVAGPLTMEMIRQVNATKVILGADALSINTGVTTPDLEISIIERNMIKYTRGQVIMLANHTKLGLIAPMSVVPLKQIDVLITNRKLPADFQNELDSLRVRVDIA